MNSRSSAFTRFLWVMAFMVSGVGVALAQTTISGTITDAENGEPLIGANILVVGTSTGTITDYDGNFELNVPAGAEQLRVSYTGYATQNIPVVAGQTRYDMKLGAGELLEEVVVVGYGTETQSEVTSAVTSVKEEDFNQGVVNNPTQLVQGKVAGLQIAQVGGDPNGTPAIRLRGLSTLGANTEPLIIIDGVIGATLQSVDPSDIASIDVLKDGSAAAIYGTRASSGVIIVTTKKGRAGETNVNYRVQGGMETVARTVQVASADEFLRLRDAAGDITTGAGSDGGARNDLIDELTRNALSQVHNLSFNGGIGTGSYRASLNYRDVEGVSNFSGFEQLNGRLNIQQSALDDLVKFDLSVSATQKDAEFGFNEAFRYATIYNPTLPIRVAPGQEPAAGYSVLGGYSQVDQFDYFNPIAINEQNTNTGRESDILLSGRVSVAPADGLNFSAFFSQNRENNRFDQFYSKTSRFVGANNNGLAQRVDEIKRNNLFELTGTYDVDLGNNTELGLLAGYSYQELREEGSFLQGGGLISDFVGPNNLGQANRFREGLGNVASGGDLSELESYFGRVSLDIDNTYFVKASVRSDGSSRFGANEKRGVFPAISGGVNLGSFVDNANVNTLKLRVGYGVTGNIPGQSYLTQTLYVPQGSFYFNGGFVPAYGPNRNANPNLRFEKKGELNAGLDFAFLDYKLTGSIDYFRRRTTDLIYEVSVPVPPNLAPTTFVNLEDVAFQNTGVEFTVGYEVGNADGFSWSPRVVISTVKTILDSVEVDDPEFTFFQGRDFFFDELTSPGSPGANGAPIIITRIGEEVGQMFGLVAEGIGDDGNFIFADLNNDGMIDDGGGTGIGADEQVIGNGLPDWTLGFSNEFRYGNLDASFFLRGAFGHDLYHLNRFFYENVAPARGTDNIVTTELFDPRLTSASEQVHSYFVEDASFITLDNASIGYTFPMEGNEYLKNLRVGISGQRLFYITDYTGVDPEVRYADPGRADNGNRPQREFNPSPLAPGIDRRYNYLRTRSFNLALSVNF